MSGPCPLCFHEAASGLFQSRDRVHGLPGVFTVFQCHRCSAVFYLPRLGDQELASYYPEIYGRYRVSRSLDKRSYRGIRRFILENQETREYRAERWCYKGSIDDWIYAGHSGKINALAFE